MLSVPNPAYSAGPQRLKIQRVPERGRAAASPVSDSGSEIRKRVWGSIEKQTTFPVRTLLKLKQELHHQNNNYHWYDSPLVGFSYNKGENWRVYGCFTDVADDISNYVRLLVVPTTKQRKRTDWNL